VCAVESSSAELTPQYLAAVERLAEHVQVVQDILDEIREELQWAVRNHEPIRLDRIPQTVQEWSVRLNPERRYPAIPELLTCDSCDSQCDSLQEALQEGWEGLRRDDGRSWNFLATCPTCLEEERAEATRGESTGPAEERSDVEPRNISETAPGTVDSSSASTQKELF
jgi:hypothetical protein